MHLRFLSFGVALAASGVLAACATSSPVPQQVEAPKPAVVIAPATQALVYKRKVAIGRFTNETLYGKALLTGEQMDPLGRQTSDMLSTMLVQSGKFIVLERPDLWLARGEQEFSGVQGNNVGADALIIGSLTEFGREIEGEAGFLSNTKRQVARAKVELRLIDVKTARVFFTASGAGKATTEAATVMGFGDRAGYDSTLNDRAIGAAISDVLNQVVTKLAERPWRSDILKVEGSQVIISGGKRQGLKAGDHLAVMESGSSVRSAQSGFDVALPPTQVGEIVVQSTFGDNETDEGSICRLVSGSILAAQKATLFVAEVGK